MNKYLRAVGFSNINTQDEFDRLLEMAYADCEVKNVKGTDVEDVSVDCYKYYGDSIGIYLCGNMDENEKVTITECFPYVEGKHSISIFDTSIEQPFQGRSILAFTDKKNLNQLSGYTLQDISKVTEIKSVVVNVLSTKGTVLLPVIAHHNECEIRNKEEKRIKALMTKARRGDIQATRELESNLEHRADLLNERMASEDFFTVVESYYEPSGENPTAYSFLGSITKVQTIRNQLTGENIYKLLLNLTGTKIAIFINHADITGMPTAGMRFWGSGVFQCTVANI